MYSGERGESLERKKWKMDLLLLLLPFLVVTGNDDDNGFGPSKQTREN